MPLTHERTFRVRHYECDAYGHVNNANYLRYMQEAAFDASAAAGYDLARYAALGHHWLVRETDIEYLAPLRYGDSVRVKTWVEDFQRVRSRRAYELYRTGDGVLVARATTDWVYLDSRTGRPDRIPPEMIASFLPEGAGGHTAPASRPRQPFPKAPPPPPGRFAMRRKVMWQEIDPAGHVNNAQYLGYISDCGLEVAEAYGWPGPRMLALGFGILVRRHRVVYLEPALMGDELEVATYVYNMRRATASRVYSITRVTDGVLLARADVFYAWVKLQTGLPTRIPADFAQDFAGEHRKLGVWSRKSDRRRVSLAAYPIFSFILSKTIEHGPCLFDALAQAAAGMGESAASRSRAAAYIRSVAARPRAVRR